MEYKILGNSFLFFPGVYLTMGKNKIAFINISNGEVHRIEKDIIESANKEYLEELEKTGLGLIRKEGNPKFTSFSKNIKFPLEEGLKVQVLERVDLIKYIEMPIRSIDIFYHDPSNIDKNKIGKTIAELGHMGIHQFYLYDPEKCPYNLIEDKPKVIAYLYLFCSKYNPCWGLSIAIDTNGDVKPCLWSDIIVGNLRIDRFIDIKNELIYYWELNKEKIDICKECELKLVCSDCRVLAKQINGSIHAKTTSCAYIP